MENYKKNFDKTMDELNKINDKLLNPDTFVWGKMTEEETDDYFNDPTSDMYDEWGNKSFNILMEIEILNVDEELGRL